MELSNLISVYTRYFSISFTLIMLEKKVVFVCEDKNILTLAVFLFAKVFPRPFEYPYPIVSMIPDDYEYLNAPFPIVYGFCKSRDILMRDNIPKYYKNVYVIISPKEVNIYS
eukprot:GHVR01021693.1.p1 GENE.GHVR01021693.1~~GHVR01021693.1.p1  ORF type:complete len:112 (-),score=0.17 GHVR01021693.1:747-1082(-)